MLTTPPGVTRSSATSSIRCSVRRACLDLKSALEEEHAQSKHTSSSSSVPLGSSIRLCAEDICLMHHSQAQQPQPLGRKDRAALTSAKQFDASALATSVTLFGPGAHLRKSLLIATADVTCFSGFSAGDTTCEGSAYQSHAAMQGCLSEVLPSCSQLISTLLWRQLEQLCTRALPALWCTHSSLLHAFRGSAAWP